MSLFISYSHADSTFAQKLAFELIRSKAHIWMDVAELKAGDSLIDRIQAALESAGAVVVILSRASVESEWCKKELSSALIRELDEKHVVVIPVLMEDCIIPLFLRGKMYADFRSDFDHGLKQLLDAIAADTSETLGRLEHGNYHTDWSIDWFHEDELFRLRITLLDHYDQAPYSVLTEILIQLNKAATKRQRLFDLANLGWFGRHAIVERLAQLREHKDLLLLLEDQFPKTKTIVLADTAGSGAVTKVKVSSRRIGEDNGKDILVNVAQQLGLLCDAQRQRLRKTTHQEDTQILAILHGLAPRGR